MPNQTFSNIPDALCDCLESANECDSNGERANVVDGLFAIARSLDRIAKAISDSDDDVPIKINSGPF